VVEGEEAEEPVEGEVVHGVHARHVADGEEEDGGVGGDRVVGLAGLWTQDKTFLHSIWIKSGKYRRGLGYLQRCSQEKTQITLLWRDFF